MIFVLIYQDYNLHLVGPFGPSRPGEQDPYSNEEDCETAKEAASAYGQRWQKLADDDPRWQVIELDEAYSAPVISPTTFMISAKEKI